MLNSTFLFRKSEKSILNFRAKNWCDWYTQKIVNILKSFIAVSHQCVGFKITKSTWRSSRVKKINGRLEKVSSVSYSSASLNSLENVRVVDLIQVWDILALSSQVCAYFPSFFCPFSWCDYANCFYCYDEVLLEDHNGFLCHFFRKTVTTTLLKRIWKCYFLQT